MSDDSFRSLPSNPLGTMPNGEPQSIPDRYKIQDDTSHKKIRELSPYEFVLHAFEGSHGFRDCSYLIPHPREQFYETRRESSYYVNAFAPIVNAMVEPCYVKEPTRTCDNAFYEMFIENCDNAGTSLDDFLEVLMIHARMFGVTFVVVDNFPSSPQTVSEALAGRAFPYIYEKMPQDVYKKETDRWGNLLSITFFDRCEKILGAERRVYRFWDRLQYVEFYERSTGEGVEEVVIDSGVHGLGSIPVVPVVGFAKTNSLKELPNPPAYDLAMLTFALFNKESQIVTLEQFQAFSIFCVSDFDPTSLTVGPTTFLNCGPNSKFSPMYASPNTDNIRVLVENCDRIKKEIKDQAGQRGVIAIETAQSGVAKEWDFRAEEKVLLKTCTVAVNTEEKIAEVFSLYVNKDVNLEVSYPSSFSPSYENQRIDSSLKIIRETPPEEVTEELWKEIVLAFWANDKDKALELIAEIEANEPSSGDGVDGSEGEEGDGSEGGSEDLEADDDTTTIPDQVAGAAGATIQDTALNGAQITSLLEVIGKVTTGEITTAAAAAILSVSFPAVSPEKIQAIMATIKVTAPEKVTSNA